MRTPRAAARRSRSSAPRSCSSRSSCDRRGWHQAHQGGPVRRRDHAQHRHRHRRPGLLVRPLNPAPARAFFSRCSWSASPPIVHAVADLLPAGTQRLRMARRWVSASHGVFCCGVDPSAEIRQCPVTMPRTPAWCGSVRCSDHGWAERRPARHPHCSAPRLRWC